MPKDLKKRSGTPVGNFNFSVKIYDLEGGESPVLILPVNAVRNLGGARVTTMRHRTNASGHAVLTPYPGVATADSSTLEGNFLFDNDDVRALEEWVKQAKGRPSVLDRGAIAGYFRTMVVTPFSDTVDDDGNDVPGGVVAGSFQLTKVVPVKFSLSEFDINAPAISNWSLEIDYEDMQSLSP